MKTWILSAVIAAVALSFAAADVQAKRLGGGKSTGMQRDMPARTAPDAAPGKPATPAQAAPQQAGNPAVAPGAAAAPAKRSWMGPLAGLAAGLGIAALMSHFGMGEGMGNILMIALLAMVAFVVIRLIMRRFSPAPTASAPTNFTGSGNGSPAQVAWPSPASSAPALGSSPAAAAPEVVENLADAKPVDAKPAIAKVFVPAAFDTEGFERVAKMIFIRLQAANDSGDLEDLRSFTTPEMFASARLDLQDRGDVKQQTDVIHVDAKVLDVAQEGERQIVSVRFTGQVREEAGAAPTSFNEIWHLVKPLDDSRNWAIAGIEQAQ